MSLNNILYKNDSDLVYSTTKFVDIYKIFLNTISNDYRIKKMFEKDENVAEDMLFTWLLKAVTYFTDCSKDLENNLDTDNKIFDVDLTLKEQVILADLMILVWMDWNINNITQMNLSLQDSDFNRHAETQNLRGKVATANEWRERVYHEISEYTKSEIPIAQWATGNLS